MGAGRSDLTHFRFRYECKGPYSRHGARRQKKLRREDATWSRSALPPLGAGGRERVQTIQTYIYIRPYKAYTAFYMAQKAFKGNRAPQRIWELRLPGYWLRIPEPIKGLCVCVFVYVCLLYVLCRLRTLLSQTATASAYAWPGQGPCPMNQLL